MQILKLTPQTEKEILKQAVLALKNGKSVVYPTDTSYGLAVDAQNTKAINRLYKIKQRDFNKPMHVVVHSIASAKKLVVWNRIAETLSKEFLPGPLSLFLVLKEKKLSKVSAGSGYLGIRIPKNGFVLKLAKSFGRPFTATGANPAWVVSKGFDSYSAEDVIKQFKNKKYKPDLIIDAGKLKKVKPSTLVKIYDDKIEVLRKGPVSEKSMLSLLSK
jgi:L-threonylcarbamoyladenylate synthase